MVKGRERIWIKSFLTIVSHASRLTTCQHMLYTSSRYITWWSTGRKFKPQWHISKMNGVLQLVSLYNKLKWFNSLALKSTQLSCWSLVPVQSVQHCTDKRHMATIRNHKHTAQQSHTDWLRVSRSLRSELQWRKSCLCWTAVINSSSCRETAGTEAVGFW